MDHTPHNPTPPPAEADLARLYVDGELTGEQRQQFEQRLAAEPSLRERVEFERVLRERIITVMNRQHNHAPAGLEARVRAALDDVTDPAELAPAVLGVIGGESDAERSGASAGEHDDAPAAADAGAQKRWSIFSGPRRANLFAVAASILVIGSVVLVGIFGPSIDELGSRVGSTDLISQAARWADDQHTECTLSADFIANKLSSPASELHDDLARHLGVDDLVEFDFESMGYVFVGAGACHVPGAERSLHLLYEREVPGDPHVLFSVFLAPDHGQYGGGGAPGGLYPGHWMAVKTEPPGSKPIYAFSDGSIAYFIAACDEQDYYGLAKLIEAQISGE